nr:MAG TPA: hypothetical protein [Caudoviricetes sp.]
MSIIRYLYFNILHFTLCVILCYVKLVVQDKMFIKHARIPLEILQTVAYCAY